MGPAENQSNCLQLDSLCQVPSVLFHDAGQLQDSQQSLDGAPQRHHHPEGGNEIQGEPYLIGSVGGRSLE